MALDYVIPNKESVVAKLVADRRLHLAADQKTIVEEGDPAAAFLLAAKGHDIAGEDAARLGLTVVDGKVVQGGAPTKAVPLMHTLNAEDAIAHVQTLATLEEVAAAKVDEESRKPKGARKSVIEALDAWAAELAKK